MNYRYVYRYFFSEFITIKRSVPTILDETILVEQQVIVVLEHYSFYAYWHTVEIVFNSGT
jgi:hypothetical protein